MKQKTVTDYADEVAKYYPKVSLSDIKKIINFGWKAFYLANHNGTDVLFNRQGFFVYCGTFFKNSIDHFLYYRRKLANKIRYYHKLVHTPYYGYYYFSRSLEQFNDYLALKNKRGRPRKTFTFEKVMFYQLKDECLVRNSGEIAIFRIPITFSKGLRFYKPIIKTDLAELVYEHKPLNFKDLMEINSKYDYSCKKRPILFPKDL